MGARNFFNFGLSLVIIYLLFVAVPTACDVFVKCSSFMCTIWLAEWLMQVTRKHVFYKRVSSEGKAVFITGCDSGFGHTLAQHMDSLGFRVFAGCLNSTAGGATNLIESCSSRLQIVPLDVTSDQSVLSARNFVERNLKTDVLWCVVNNAGVVQSGEMDWTPVDDVHMVHQVNTLGVVRVSKVFLPLLKKSGGRLVNNASACGKFICPGFVGYCMSKCATIAFSVGLRVEMMKWGVKVISVEPFFYKTPLTQADSTDAVIERTWQKADAPTRRDYGDAYLDNFKKSSRLLLSRSSPRVDQVIDCFADAITAEDPLDTYFPAYLPDKIGIKILQLLPGVVRDGYLRLQLERGCKPAAART